MAGRIRFGAVLLALLPATCLTGCASIASSAAAGLAGNLSAAILEQDDPELVREATPAYLVLIDSFARDSSDPEVLGAAAELYAAYGTLFVDDADRSRRLTDRALTYGRRAVCAADETGCELQRLDFDAYSSAIAGLRKRSGDALFSYSLGTLAWIQAHSADFQALAELPKVELALLRAGELTGPERQGDIYKYLGVLNSLRPPALGGDPGKGKAYFERAIELTEGRDLSVKVEYARGYARLVYDRELHDQLLNEVLTADVQQPGLTLFNRMAQAEAKGLLASADDYF